MSTHAGVSPRRFPHSWCVGAQRAVEDWNCGEKKNLGDLLLMFLANGAFKPSLRSLKAQSKVAVLFLHIMSCGHC